MTSDLALVFIIIITFILRYYGSIAAASHPVWGGGQAASPRAGERDSRQSGGAPGKFHFNLTINYRWNVDFYPF